jgi:3-oxoacyl-ACP reductase-like protein
MEEETVRRQLEYTILTDFILSNTDRHYNNFGFLYDPRQHKLMKMAPIFDTGNALFYDQEFIPSKNNLLNVKVTSFCKRESDMLRYVTDPSWFPIARVEGFSEMVQQMLMEYTEMPADRAEQIAGTVEQKLDYLKQFLSGTKIWKKEKYW